MISPYSLTVPGGVQHQILGLARALRAKGVDTRILAPCDGPPPDAGVTPLGASIPTAANGSVAPLAPDPSAQLRVVRALRDEAFDVLHVHEPMAPGPTLTAAVLKPCPMVGTFHRAGESRTYRMFSRGVRWAQRRFEVCVAVSEEAAAVARSQIGGEYEVLFNGVDVAGYQAVPRLDPDRPSILFCGRHEPRKGLEVLIDAMRAMPTDVDLWVASDGPETERLRIESAGDPRIHWIGRVSEAQKIELMRAASVFCAPSLGGESFGIVLLEGMAAETPVVASNLAGYAMVARHGSDAVLVEPGDPVDLAAGLRRALARGPEIETMVASGFERAQAYSMAHLAERYLVLYEKAIGSAPAVDLL